MKIKLLTTIMLAGFREPVRQGQIVEAQDEADVLEYKALVAAEFAKETKDEPTTSKEAAATTPPISGVTNGDDAALLDILKGNVPAIVAQLDALDADQLARLGELEAAGADRKGVHEAIAELSDDGQE